MTVATSSRFKAPRETLLQQYKRHRPLMVLLLPVLAYYATFHYWPMSGIVIAFKNFRFNDGIFSSPLALNHGFAHFLKLFTGMYFWPVFRNTLIISLYKVVFTFPAPILLALLLNEIRSQKFKRIAQTITYIPYFISWVVLASIVIEALSPSRGFVNYFLNQFGITSIYFVGDPRTFRSVLVGSGIWRNTGYQAIVFLAAMSNIDPEMYDVADLDGASRMQKIVNVTVPSIMPTIIIMFIFALGGIMNDDFDQVYNLLNAKTLSVGDVISTYTYRVGLQQIDYSYATAVGLFRNVVALVLLTGSNFVFRRVSETSLF